MSERVTMPALGESVTEGTVTRWLKSVGDTVQVDEPLLEVSTDKVDTEIPSPIAGTLEQILVQEDETVPVGADLAVIGDGSGGGDGADAGESAGGGSEDQAAAQEAEQPAPTPSTEAPVNEATSEPEQAQSDAPAPAEDSGGNAGGQVSGGEKVTMPALGESVTEGTVTRWLKAEGDEVAVDEPLLEVSTDKVDTEIPSPVAGVLTKILVGEDETVPVGADLAIIGGSVGDASGDADAGADAGQGTPPAPEEQQQEQPAADDTQGSHAGQEPAAPEQPAAQEPQQSAEAPAETSGGSDGEQEDGDASSYVTPLVRKLAADHGVDPVSYTHLTLPTNREV